MIVLDTDVLTLIQRASGREYGRLVDRIEDSGERPVCVTIVTLEEQMRGWLAYIARARELDAQIPAYARLHALLEDYRDRMILDFDEPAAEVARHLTGQKVRIGSMDLKIAAIALSRGAILISRNLNDFRKVPGLIVEDWTA